MLNKIADTFDVSHERASTVATLMQSGYAGGLLFLCPMGDMVPRRPFIIAIILATNVMVGVLWSDQSTGTNTWTQIHTNKT